MNGVYQSSLVTGDAGVRFGDMDSPIGPLRLIRDNHGFTEIRFLANESERTKPLPEGCVEQPSAVEVAVEQLEQYFRGERRTFELPLVPRGTAFQCEVWTALQKIAFGTTSSYGAIARQLGRVNASRAIGAANGANPLPIVIPCHRVIGSGGALTGYAGGLAIKSALLKLEQAQGLLTFPTHL